MKILLAVLLMVWTGVALADVDACIREHFGNNKSYVVQGHFVSGYQLVSATHDYSKWKTYAYYFAIFWNQDQATILEMPSMYTSVLPLIGTDVTDQEGRPWSISSQTLFCGSGY
jgi:hypothetical protein